MERDKVEPGAAAGGRLTVTIWVGPCSWIPAFVLRWPTYKERSQGKIEG